MSFSFMTCCSANAKRFFAKPAFAWLSDEAKQFVLDHLADSDDNGLQTGFRVLDPDYHPANVATGNKELRDEFLKLASTAKILHTTGGDDASL